jgi:hypothetical protein
MRTRIFPSRAIYRIVELRQPVARHDESLLYAKVRFLEKHVARQEGSGFVHWNPFSPPKVEILSGQRKKEFPLLLPRCRILKVPLFRGTCACSAYKFPHRTGSGACPYEEAE